MAATYFFNTGDDTTPVWNEIIETHDFHFTGTASTSENPAPIIRPSAGYVWNSEIWIGPAVMVGGVKVSNWKAPNSVIQRAKVFKVVFDIAAGAAPFRSAYDDIGFDTWENTILSGTEASEWKALLKVYVTGKESSCVAPPVNWATMESGRLGSMNPNGLTGNASFVTVPFVPVIGDDFTFTMALAIPYDAEAGKDGKYVSRLTTTFVHV